MSKFLLLFLSLCLPGAGLHAAPPPDPWYAEIQMDTGLANGWGLQGNPAGYVHGMGDSATGLSLGLGRDFNGRDRGGLLLEQNGWNRGGWVTFNKAAVTAGVYASFWKVMRVGLDLGLGGFVRSAAGNESYGGLVLGDLRLQASIVRGLYAVAVMDWQDTMISYDKTADWFMLNGALKLGVGYEF
jgi:hypothetical protein